MASSSPYATFRAEDWMRASAIRTRKHAVRSSPDAAQRQRSEAISSVSAGSVQGELFLFPAILAC